MYVWLSTLKNISILCSVIDVFLGTKNIFFFGVSELGIFGVSEL